MRWYLPVLVLLVEWAGPARSNGLLVPEEKSLPPLAMVSHRVFISMEDQVAVTRVEQVFRNHTDRQLEATYVFPVPRGASVNKFTMSVNGKDVGGELVEAARATQIYTEIVRRTQDPGLLEYMGNNLFRLRVFPILPKSDQKVVLSYTSVANRDAGLVEYVYPLKTDGKATTTLETFSVQATIKSQHPILSIYSPTHAVTEKRENDRSATVTFEKNQGLLDKDFQLFYATGDKDVGFSPLLHRPLAGDKGYFLFLISPRLELSKEQSVPRDMILVLDTSGSMRGPKMDQAKRALKYCLSNLGPKDRFGLLNFATTVNTFHAGLLESTPEQVEQAKKWVDNLEATGGTAINDALATALDLRSSDPGRTFTIVFFTDGQPTIGETNPERILKNFTAKNSANTRVFTFGVGDDVNAALLDRLADDTRAVSTYVRPAEDIEAKVSGLYAKISHPVLANLKLTAGSGVHLEEIYPPQLPDLFHGGQVVVLGRYAGQGHAAVTLSGTVGMEHKEFVYELAFPDKTSGDRTFVEHLWARRKVGYLLDQIRANGEKKELVDETVALAKRYGIATPYTSYLIVPDAPIPVARGGRPLGAPGASPNFGLGGGGLGGFGGMPAGGQAPGAPALKALDLARQAQNKPGEVTENRAKLAEAFYERVGKEAKQSGAQADARLWALQQAGDKLKVYEEARRSLVGRDRERIQTGKLGVDLATDMNGLRNQTQLTQTAVRNVAGRNCVEFAGMWVDEGFDAKMPTVVVKAMSPAYFRLLERHGELKDVFTLGTQLVWITPSNTALVIDLNDGRSQLDDREIDRLFTK